MDKALTENAIAEYRAQLVRVNGADYEQQTRVSYRDGWVYIALPSLYNGQWTRWLPSLRRRVYQVQEMTVRLRAMGDYSAPNGTREA